MEIDVKTKLYILKLYELLHYLAYRMYFDT